MNINDNNNNSSNKNNRKKKTLFWERINKKKNDLVSDTRKKVWNVFAMILFTDFPFGIN